MFLQAMFFLSADRMEKDLTVSSNYIVTLVINVQSVLEAWKVCKIFFKKIKEYEPEPVGPIRSTLLLSISTIF